MSLLVFPQPANGSLPSSGRQGRRGSHYVVTAMRRLVTSQPHRAHHGQGLAGADLHEDVIYHQYDTIVPVPPEMLSFLKIIADEY